MHSPCLDCQFLYSDKWTKRCFRCSQRIDYWTSHHEPEIQMHRYEIDLDHMYEHEADRVVEYESEIYLSEEW
jgi:hypothetical protein